MREDLVSEKIDIDRKGQTVHKYRAEVVYDTDFQFDDMRYRVGKVYSAWRRTFDPDDLGVDEWDEDDDGSIGFKFHILSHGSVAISRSSFNDPWDSGFGGWYGTDIATARKEYGTDDPKKIIAYLESEFEEMANVLHGAVYGCLVYKDDELLDACYGFIGYSTAENGIDEFINETVDADIKRDANESCDF